MKTELSMSVTCDVCGKEIHSSFISVGNVWVTAKATGTSVSLKLCEQHSEHPKADYCSLPCMNAGIALAIREKIDRLSKVPDSDAIGILGYLLEKKHGKST